MNIHPIFEDIIRRHNELVDPAPAEKFLTATNPGAVAEKTVATLSHTTTNKKERRKMFVEFGQSEGKILVNLSNVLHCMPWDGGCKITLTNGYYLIVTDPYEELQILFDILNDCEEA